jgi:hypothetical protein
MRKLDVRNLGINLLSKIRYYLQPLWAALELEVVLEKRAERAVPLAPAQRATLSLSRVRESLARLGEQQSRRNTPRTPLPERGQRLMATGRGTRKMVGSMSSKA